MGKKGRKNVKKTKKQEVKKNAVITEQKNK